jgi:hypothetical protein
MDTSKPQIGQIVWMKGKVWAERKTRFDPLVEIEALVQGKVLGPWTDDPRQKDDNVNIGVEFLHNPYGGGFRFLVVFGPDGESGEGWDGLGYWQYYGGDWTQDDLRDPGWEIVDSGTPEEEAELALEREPVSGVS